MRKTIISVAAAAAALTAAGVAIADHSGGTGGVAAVAADFSANRERSDTYTCTGADNKSYQISRGRYTGSATGSPQLTGAIVVDVKSVYNMTDGIGWVEGRLKIRRSGSDERGSRLHLAGVISSGNNVDGFVNGGGDGASGILGNMIASYTPDGSITGRIGNGAVGAGLAVVRGKPCSRPKPAAIAVTLRVKGEVEGLNATGISVKPRDGSATQDCAVVAGVSPSVSGIVAKTATTPGTQVEIGCGVVNNQMTLLKIKKSGSRDDDDDD
jgi:hypothetical protein